MNERNRDAVISLRDVCFTYEEVPEGMTQAELDASGKKLAVDHLTLDIYDGECVAVLGHNGSGKSTFAKLCNGILVPDFGEITVYGIPTREEDRLLELRQRVGMVFQNPDNQIVATVVEEDVAFGPENLGFPPEEIRARVDNALKAVRMYKYRGHEPHKLSGGQKQRVAIAGILAMKPDTILFDESTAMLDPKGRRDIMRIIRKMHVEMKRPSSTSPTTWKRRSWPTGSSSWRTERSSRTALRRRSSRTSKRSAPSGWTSPRPPNWRTSSDRTGWTSRTTS